jgi:hypothetical protein
VVDGHDQQAAAQKEGAEGLFFPQRLELAGSAHFDVRPDAPLAVGEIGDLQYDFNGSGIVWEADKPGKGLGPGFVLSSPYPAVFREKLAVDPQAVGSGKVQYFKASTGSSPLVRTTSR